MAEQEGIFSLIEWTLQKQKEEEDRELLPCGVVLDGDGNKVVL